jgi:hypothetical protein
MILKFKNYELLPMMIFLKDAKLVGLASRGRSILISKIDTKYQDYNHDVHEVQKHYYQSDEEGNLITKKDKKTLIPKEEIDGKKISIDEIKRLANSEVKDITSEECGIDLSEYTNRMKALFKALEEYTETLEGDAAMIYDSLLTIFEEVMTDE